MATSTPTSTPASNAAALASIKQQALAIQKQIPTATGYSASPSTPTAQPNTGATSLKDLSIGLTQNPNITQAQVNAGLGHPAASQALKSFSIANSPSSASTATNTSGAGTGLAANTSTDASQQSTSGTTSRDAQIAGITDQASAIQKQIDALRAKESTAGTGIATSDTGPAKSESDTATSILNARATSNTSSTKTALDTIDEEMKRLESERQSELNTINNSFGVANTTLQNTQNTETGKASVGIANAGGYLGFSGSGQGVMLNLAREHRDQLMALDAKRQEAVQAANTALNNHQYDLAKFKAEQISAADNEAARRNQEYFANQVALRQQARLDGADKVVSMDQQNSIHNALANGAHGADGIFAALDGKVPIEKINSYLASIAPTATSGAFRFNPTQTGLLMGAGLSQQDVQTLNNTINSLGYTDAVRAQLPANVRAIADKIYLGKTGKVNASDSADPALSSTELEQTFRIVNQTGAVNTQKRNEQLFNQYVHSGNMKAAQRLTDSLVVRSLPPPEKVQFTKMGVIIDVASQLKTIQDKFAATHPDIYTAALEGGKAYAGIAKTHDWLDYVAKAQSVINSYRNSIFGASLTESELKAANLSLPDFNTDPLDNITTKMDNLESYARTERQRMVNDSIGNYNTVNSNPNGSGPAGNQSKVDDATATHILDNIVKGKPSPTVTLPAAHSPSWFDSFLSHF